MVRVECESVNAPMRVRVNSFGVTSGGVRGKSQDEDQEAGAEKTKIPLYYQCLLLEYQYVTCECTRHFT